MNRISSYLFLILLSVYSCSKESPSTSTQEEVSSNTLFREIPSSISGIDFVNAVSDEKEFNVLTYRNFYNGGGVAIGDVNGDQLPDLYFTANRDSNRLYLNQGNLKFKDVTASAGIAGKMGWSTGVSMVDINADGYLDIYVCNSGDVAGDSKENELFVNQGNGSFKEAAAEYGLNDKGFSTHASFFDYDLDGDLDCYLLNNSFKDPSRISQYKKTREERDELGGDKLYRNDNGKFIDVSEKAGIYGSQIGYGLGVSVGDLNHDMLPDIYISNDFWERDYLYFNKGDGTFREALTESISLTSISSMGADLGDINNDGHLEIFSTDMLAGDNYRLKAMTLFDQYHVEDLKYRNSYHYQILQNCLQLNDGKGSFQEIGNLANISATDWSWGALMMDFENDGWKDILVVNGIYKDIMYLDFTDFLADKSNIKKVVEEKGSYDFRDFAEYLPSNALQNFAFVNQRDLTFSNEATSLGLGKPSFSNGAAYGDLDLDGDLDIVVNNVNMPAFLYENTTDTFTNNHFIRLDFNGPEKNPLGIGVEVRLSNADRHQSYQHYTARGFQSSVAPGLVIGLGEFNSIDELQVIWPDGKMQSLAAVSADQTLIINYNDARETYSLPGPESSNVLAIQVYDALKPAITHTENEYNDFDHELLLPKMLSRMGPKMIQGDVNSDGLEDLLVLGASGQKDKLMLQGKDGSFSIKTNAGFSEKDAAMESRHAAFFDADGDQDLDLLISAGGNEYSKGIEAFLLRFYLNDGKGNFSLAPERTPPAGGELSCIRPHDFDQDGDMDLFLGGHFVPGNYGLIPQSFLFENRQGQWINITPPLMAGVGMVSDAQWSDVDGDGQKDLAIVGEWLALTIFKNEGKSFSPMGKANNSRGWWNTLEVADLDGDGDEDFIAGNWGLNTKFKASAQRPMSMFVKDFDNNKKSEFILNWYAPLDDKAYPFAPKGEITKQMPHLRKSILKYEDYAKKTYEDLFSPEEQEGAIKHEADQMAHAIFWNDGGNIAMQVLPLESQVAPVFSIVPHDFNKDGMTDLLMLGNFHYLKPQAGRHNDNKGVLLLNQGDKQFNYLPPSASGINVEGEVRDASILNRATESPLLIIGRNNENVLTFELP